MNGLVLVDKPGGCTSHDVVNRWRRLAGTKRVGHLGTLDPMATGLLVLVSGLATRLAPYFVLDEKSYAGEVLLGVTSDTYDIEGEMVTSGAALPLHADIAGALRSFEGEFLQLPPPVSAKKINGVAAYKLVRQNIEFELKPVPVQVKNLRWQMTGEDRLRFDLTCSSGTYIRSIAHELGKMLGCGAVLSKLRRTQVANISVERAHSLEQLQLLAREGKLNEAVIPMGQILPDLPAEHVTENVERAIRQGRDFHTSPFVIAPGAPKVRALSRVGDLIAIGELRFPNVYHPSTVL